MTQDTLPSLSQDADASAVADAAFLREQLERQRDEIVELQATVRSLQAEIRGLRGSLSWTVTRPLRTLARSLPGLAAIIQRTLDRTKDVLAAKLPKQVTRALFDNR